MSPPRAAPEEVTDLLRAWREGDTRADDLLLERVYSTLRNIAVGQLRAERSGHTLQPTALVHEAYLRLIGQREVDWRDRAHFFGLAAVTMRRILVDHARRRLAKKRGAGEEPEPLHVATGAGEAVDLLDLDRALDRFAENYPRQAKVVEMRYFSGLEFDDVALAWEIDSYAFHLSPQQYARTLERHARLTAHGVAILHTLPTRLRRQPLQVLAELRAAYDHAAARPRPDVHTPPA